MITIAVIGLGAFGIRVIEELAEENVEVVIVDKNREMVEKYKNLVRDAYITDAITNEMIDKIVPHDVAAVVIDFGSDVEASILLTNHLHKTGIQKIIVKAKTTEHGEILKMVGATSVVYPDHDAAQRIVPQLLSSELFSFLTVSPLFALAEVAVSVDDIGKTLAAVNFRQTYKLNVIAYRQSEEQDFEFIDSGDFVFVEGMRLLIAGKEKDINTYVRDTSILSRFEGKASKLGKKFQRRLAAVANTPKSL